MDDPLNKFIDDMLASKSWNTTIDEDAKKQLAEDLKNRLLDQIDQAVISALPEDRIDGLNELLDKEVQDEEVSEYIANSGVDVQRVTTQAMLRFRELNLDGQA